MSDCQHRPRKADTKAGYEACMFCVETGECDGKKGWCRRHEVVWAVWLDRDAVRNTRF